MMSESGALNTKRMKLFWEYRRVSTRNIRTKSVAVFHKGASSKSSVADCAIKFRTLGKLTGTIHNLETRACHHHACLVIQTFWPKESLFSDE